MLGIENKNIKKASKDKVIVRKFVTESFYEKMKNSNKLYWFMQLLWTVVMSSTMETIIIETSSQRSQIQIYWFMFMVYFIRNSFNNIHFNTNL